MNTRLKTLTAAVVAACAAMSTLPALAKTTTWTTAAGYESWSSLASWNNGVPAAGDAVLVTNGSATNKYSQLNYSNTLAGAYAELQVNATSTGSMTLGIAAVNAFVGNMYVATFAGGGAVDHYGNGVLNVSGGLNLGYSAGTNGIYNLSAGNLNANNYLLIGNSGAGTFNQGGGAASVTNQTFIGQLAGSTGTYNLSGGTLSTSTVFVGNVGTGKFNQSAGTHAVSNLTMGLQTGSSGTYILSGGTLNMGSMSNGAGNSRLEINGGTLNWTGSSMDVDVLVVAYNPGNNASLTIAAGKALVTGINHVGWGGTGLITQTGGDHTAGATYLGSDTNGVGTYIHSGGTHSVSNLMVMAYGANSTGNYNLSGTGQLTTDNIYIGLNGVGNFNQTGGSFNARTQSIGSAPGAIGAYNQSAGNNTVSQTIFVSDSASAQGTYSLSGGTLTTVGAYVGNAGTGLFNQTGGTVNISGALKIGHQAGSSGVFQLTGGALNVTTVDNGAGIGALHIDGGALNVSGTSIDVDTLRIGNAVGSTGSFALLAGKTLTAPGQFIGVGGTGSLTQSGGTNHTVTSYIGENGTGTYTLSGGTHNVGNLIAVGTNAGSTGTYNLSGTGALVANSTWVGYNGGQGSFNQSGGTNTSPILWIGSAPTGSGSYLLSGGNLTVNGEFRVGTGGAGSFQQTGGTSTATTLQVGASSAGSYTQSAGSTSTTTVLQIGDNATGAGTYNLSGTGALAAKAVNVGNLGTGTVNQSGGTQAVTNTLTLGLNAGSTGSLNLSGGTLSASTMYLGYAGKGSFVQTGGANNVVNLDVGYGAAAGGVGSSFSQSAGSNTVTGVLGLARLTNSKGDYLLSGTGALTSPVTEVGDLGFGTFTQSGGTHNTTTLLLAKGASGFATYFLTGGVLNVGSVQKGAGFSLLDIAGGTLNLSGASISVNQLFIDAALGKTGSFTLAAGKTLSADQQTNIDGAGNNSLTQTGGSFNTGGLNLGGNTGNSGVFNLSGGTATTAIVRVGGHGTGTVVHSGGTLTTDKVTVGGGSVGFAGFGSYTLSGSGVLNAPVIEVGNVGGGSFLQSGGSNTVSTLRMGLANAGGTYTLSGGSLSLGDILGSDTSVFNVDGGTLSFSGSSLTVGGLRVGLAAGSNGSFTLKAGQSVASKGQDIGLFGSGTFNQTGGNNTDGYFFTMGSATGSNGTYNHSGGSLSVRTLVVGRDGTGSYNQTGGTVTSLTQLSLGGMGGLGGGTGTGTYTMSGGTLAVDSVYNGAGTGTFNYNGGTLQVASAFDVDQLNIGSTASFSREAVVGNALVNLGNLTVGSLLTVGGSLDNSGVMTLAGGTLTGGGALANNALMTGRGTISGTGGFSNNGLLQQSGGNLLLSNSGANVNNGQWELLAGFQLQLGNPTTLVNGGSLNLKGGSVTGTGSLNNWSTGTITGNGTISSVFGNNGSLVIDSGTTNVTRTFTNGTTGQMLLGSNGATLSGGTINNSGLIQGFGKVNNAVTNTGTVEAAGGTLTLAGSLSNTGTLTANSGAKLLVTQGLASNAGTLQLAGGSFDNNGVALINAATGNINGAGTLRAGAITNNGKLQLSGGVSSVYGNLVSNALSKVILSGNSNGTFYGTAEIKAGAELRVSAGSVATFFGKVFQRNGSSFTGTGAKFYEGGLAIGGSPGLGTDAGDVTFGVDSSYEAEIGGLTACTLVCETDTALRDSSFDKYRVAGYLGLGGTLKITSWNGYVGQVGQHFDLLDWGTSSGTFSHIDSTGFMLAQGANLDLSQLYSSGAVSITAVPEPGTYAMLLAGIGLVGWRARRRESGQRAA